MRALTAVLVLAALVSPAASRAACPADANTQRFTAPGRYGVGVRTLKLVDTLRRTPAHNGEPGSPDRKLTTEVWYPAPSGDVTTAQRDAPLGDGGPFPLVVMSHGYLDTRLGEGVYARSLASRGFIVAAPDFPLSNGAAPGGPTLIDLANQPGDVSFVINTLVLLSRTPDTWLADGVNRRRIGAAGLSLGGLTTIQAVFDPAQRNGHIRAAAPLAPIGCFFTQAYYRASRRPLLVVQGDEDLILPFDQNGARVFSRSRSPGALVTLLRGTHTGFSGFITAPSPVSYDTTLGCPALGDVTQQGGDAKTFVRLLGGPGIGIDATGCMLPCQGKSPSHPPMVAQRQHDLTTAALNAFFEATFKHSRDARCFLAEGLAAENADVRVETRAGGSSRRHRGGS
jgi:dienelactone hydrolase